MSRTIRKGRTGLTAMVGLVVLSSLESLTNEQNMIWFTFFPSLEDFQKALRRPSRKPEWMGLRGHLYGTVRTATLETLIDEMGQIWVEGSTGWRAVVWREGQQFKAAEVRLPSWGPSP
jgi:hypothetical protein